MQIGSVGGARCRRVSPAFRRLGTGTCIEDQFDRDRYRVCSFVYFLLDNAWKVVVILRLIDRHVGEGRTFERGVVTPAVPIQVASFLRCLCSCSLLLSFHANFFCFCFVSVFFK